MKNKELINILSKLDPDAEILKDSEGFITYINFIESGEWLQTPDYPDGIFKNYNTSNKEFYQDMIQTNIKILHKAILIK